MNVMGRLHVGGALSIAAAQILLVAPTAVLAQTPMGTTFTYQGKITLSNIPIEGTDCCFDVSLWDAALGGTQLATWGICGPDVSEGLFTLPVDFGQDMFDGTARWLEIAVCCQPPDDCSLFANFTTLTPRQKVTPAPHALALPGLWTQQNSTSPNLIGGFSGNTVTSAAVGATIGGGGHSADINRVTDEYGTVAGGSSNQAGNGDADTTNATHASVGGGQGNTASGKYATVGGGRDNQAAADFATVAGGGRVFLGVPASANRVTDNFGTVGGGGQNLAGNGDANPSNATFATVSGGVDNTASGFATTVAGGTENTASMDSAFVGGGNDNTASGAFSVIGGGAGNVASGDRSTIPGGLGNTAAGRFSTIAGGFTNAAGGDFSLAAGRQAKVRDATQSGDVDGDEGTFVWADSTPADFTSTGPDQFLIRASGGVGIGTTAPLSTLHVVGTGRWFGSSTGTLLRVSQSGTGAAMSVSGSGGSGPAMDVKGTVKLGDSSSVNKLDVWGNKGVSISNSTAYSRTAVPGGSLIVQGDVGIGTTAPSAKLDVQGDVNISGTLTANGGVSMGRISLTTGGTILTTDGGTRVLLWDKTNGEIELTNSSGDFLDFWWQTQTFGTFAGGGGATSPATSNVVIISGTNSNTKGFEVHFGQADGAKGWCSVWLQYANGRLVGHFIKY